MDLETLWHDIWFYDLGLPSNIAKIKTVTDEYERILAIYNGPDRYYHSLNHIKFCIDKLYEIFQRPLSHINGIDRFAIIYSVIYHDLIYNSRSSDNEEQSANEAIKSLCAISHKHEYYYSMKDNIRGLIMATKHTGPPIGMWQKVICDIDLAGLGQPFEEFDRDTQLIRKEWLWANDMDFATHRAKILQGFLDKDYIYYTLPFREKYELQARENLTRSIAKLKRVLAG